MGLTSMLRVCWTFARITLLFRASILLAELACSFCGNNHWASGAKEFVGQGQGPIPMLKDLYLFGQHESEKHGVLRREESPQRHFPSRSCWACADQVI
jgi:hypothetical protein